MDFYSHQVKTAYLNQPCNIAMGGCKYVSDKMVRKPVTPCRESSEGFEYPSLFSSKTYSILSYIVGGFVGSKSQMNNNKHNLSYDLSAAIFNILNPCKYDKVRKNGDNFYNTTSKFNPECYEKYIGNKSSHRNEKNCMIMDFDWLSALPLHDFIDQDNYVSALNNFTIIKNSENEKSEKNENTNMYNPNIQTQSKVESHSIAPENEAKSAGFDLERLNSLDIPIVEGLSNSSLEPAKSIAESGCLDKEKEHSLNYLASRRFRQQSECSVESTDSESFIVFDDYSNEDNEGRDGIECLSLAFDIDDDEDDEDDEEEEQEDEDDVDDCGSDIYLGDKELVEANNKWTINYGDICVQDNDSEKKVRFNEDVVINKIVAWDYAYRAARPGPWEQMARDRVRFRERILRLSSIISPCLRKEHRDKIYKKLHS